MFCSNFLYEESSLRNPASKSWRSGINFIYSYITCIILSSDERDTNKTFDNDPLEDTGTEDEDLKNELEASLDKIDTPTALSADDKKVYGLIVVLVHLFDHFINMLLVKSHLLIIRSFYYCIFLYII